MAPLKDTAEIKGIRNVHLRVVEAEFEFQSINFFDNSVDDPNFQENMVKAGVAICNATYNDPEVQEIIKAGRGSQKYDILVIDQSFNDYVLPLGHLMGVPTVYLSTVFLMPSVAWTLNVPTPYSYIPMAFHVADETMNFVERAKNAISMFSFTNLFHKTFFPKYEAVIRKHIPDSPPLLELEKNVSLVLLNTNPAIHSRRPTMPYIIEVGCLHCRAPKVLPKVSVSFNKPFKEPMHSSFNVTSRKLSCALGPRELHARG